MKDYSEIIRKRSSAISYGSGAKFTRFLTAIELSKYQKQDASDRLLALRLKMATAFPGSKCFVVGSYGKNTAIRPPSDLDIMLVLPKSIYERYSIWAYLLTTRNAQSEFLQEVKRKIEEHFPATELKADRQVIAVKYASSFSAEIIPCFHIPDSTKYKIADTKDGGNWTEVNPDKEAKSLSESNAATTGNTVRLIKMIKCWKKNCNVPLKSFHLEILAQEFLANYKDSTCSPSGLDLLVKDFFRWLYNKGVTLFFDPSIIHPGTGEEINIGKVWQSKVDSALDAALAAISQEQKGNSSLANSEWQKIFGKDFVG